MEIISVGACFAEWKRRYNIDIGQQNIKGEFLIQIENKINWCSNWCKIDFKPLKSPVNIIPLQKTVQFL